MARIDGNAPKIPQSLQSLEAPKPLTPAAPVAVPLPVPNLGMPGGSELVGMKPKLANLTGGRGKAALPDTEPKAELIAMLKEGMGNSGALPSSLQIKGGVEAKGETKGGGKRTAEDIAKSVLRDSRTDTGEAMANLSAADKKTLLAGIKNGTVTDGNIVMSHLATLVPDTKAQVAFVQSLTNKKAIDGLAEVWRSGAMDNFDPKLKIAVGVEMAANTAWGKDKANAGPVAALRKAALEGKITGDLPLKHDAIATAENGAIKFKDGLLKNPEAAAAIFAHEGTHLHQGTNCCGGKGAASPQGETEGTLAGVAVWNQLGKTNGDPAGAARDSLNAMAKRLKDGGPGLVKQAVTEGYRNQASNKLNNPDTKWGTAKGTTKADWEARLKEYEAELAKMKPGGDLAKAAIQGAGKGGKD